MKPLIMFCIISLVSFAPLLGTDIDTYLLTARKGSALKMQKKKVKYLKQSSSGMPLVDDVEIRVRNQALEFDNQRYTLRVEPCGFGETKAARQLYRNQLSFNKLKEKRMLAKRLKRRYDDVLDCLEKHSLLQLHKELAVIYEDRVKVLEKLTESSDFSLSDLIQAEDRFTESTTENIEREQRHRLLQKKIQNRIKDSSFVMFDTTDLVSIDSVAAFIENTDFKIGKKNIYMKYEKLQLQRAESEYRLETAQGRRYISFLEFSFDDGEWSEELERKNVGKAYDLGRAYLFEVGLRIPFINMDKNDVNRRMLKYYSDKQNFEQINEDLEDKIEKDSDDIRVLLAKYKYLQRREEDINSESSLKKYLEMDGIEPIRLLSIKESIVKNKIAREKVKHDILRNYIRVLDVSGMLADKPLKNYLSAKQKAVADG